MLVLLLAVLLLVLLLPLLLLLAPKRKTRVRAEWPWRVGWLPSRIRDSGS